MSFLKALMTTHLILTGVAHVYGTLKMERSNGPKNRTPRLFFLLTWSVLYLVEAAYVIAP